MSWIRCAVTHVREWFDRNFTFQGLLFFLWFVALNVPKAFGVKNFWSTHLILVWRFLSQYSTSSLTVLCAIFIWLDHKRVLKNLGPKPHDAKTIRGRTLQLRDDLQKLLQDATTKWPEHIQGSKTTPHNDSLLEDALRRGSYIHHTFALQFASRAEIIYHECGLAGTANDGFMVRVGQGIASSSKLKEIIGDLDWMAKHVEPEVKPSAFRMLRPGQ